MRVIHIYKRVYHRKLFNVHLYKKRGVIYFFADPVKVI